MTSRLLLVSSDTALIQTVKAALNAAASLLQVDHLSGNEERLHAQFQPSGIIVDSDARSGVHTAFERIAEARRQFPALPVIAMGNEMSAQLVLAALRAGASDFIDRDAGTEQIRHAIQSCLSHHGEPQRHSRSRIAGILSSLPSEQDQDFALNLAIRAARRAPSDMVLYIDLSLPVTQAGVALALEMKFAVPDAVRELSRLDRPLLETAVARDPRSGLYVMPLLGNLRTEGPPLEAESFQALLQVLQSIFDIIVIGYGPFSRQRALLEMTIPNGHFFLCCNQRFSSIQATGDFLGWLAGLETATQPDIVVHEMAPGLIPAPADICKALRVPRSINVVGSWSQLAQHLNNGTPAAFASASRYCQALDACLGRMGGFAVPAERSVAARVRSWLKFHAEARAS
jgi:pilus assembly protein CpaE